MEYIDLFALLSKNNIRYLVCGGLAVNIYGIPRMTADIDLLLDFEEGNVSHFENLIKQLLYTSVIPLSIKTFVNKEERQKAIDEKNLIAYSYYNSRSNYMNLDVLLDVPLRFEELWEKREKRPLNDFEISVVSIEHLIELKNYANRKQDMDDIILLSKLLKK